MLQLLLGTDGASILSEFVDLQCACKVLVERATSLEVKKVTVYVRNENIGTVHIRTLIVMRMLAYSISISDENAGIFYFNK